MHIFSMYIPKLGFLFQPKKNVFVSALKNGDLDRVLVPTDTEGRKCGIDSVVIDKPYLFFFDLAKCVDASVPFVGCRTPQVCVSECPKTDFLFDRSKCLQDFDGTLNRLICRLDVDKRQLRTCNDIETHINDEKCAKWYLESKSCKYIEFSFLSHFFLLLSLF